jgi:epsilon-lactone hydrolase
VASLRSTLAPLVLTLRGSKRQFSSAKRTLARIAHLGDHPARFDPPRLRVPVTRRDVGGWPVFDVGDARSERRAVYLHGGVYVFEIDPLHWRFVALLAEEAGVCITVPIMPLAPSGVASVIVPAVADIVASLAREVGASRVSVLGDSSGGGMALATAMLLRDRGAPPLANTVLIAPWLDISGTDPRLAEIAPSDPWLAVPGTHAAGALYRAELTEFDPLVSPLYGSLEGLGPITMFSGTRDILNADAARLVTAAGASAVQLDYFEGAGMIHNYPILPMPEGDAARKVIVEALSR